MPQCHSSMPSWNTHAVITRTALSAAKIPRLDDSIPVIALEAFLPLARKSLQNLLKWDYELLDRKVQGVPSKRGKVAEIPKEILTTGDFLAALKLNVSQPLHYVRALTPEEISPDTPHDPSRSGPPGGMYVETRQQETIQAREVFCTFSDEPDWGMDQDLFSVGQYGYGSCPFGSGDGPSSQAPFHMAFLHENPLVMALRPSLGRSFLEERVQIFFALAGLAMDSGVEVPGDGDLLHGPRTICRTLHNRIMLNPFLPPGFRFSFVSSCTRVPRKFAAKNENYLKNRHILFEAAVHFLLNEAVKKRVDHPFLRALAGKTPQGGFETRPYWPIDSKKNIRSLITESSQVAANLGRRTDRALMALMDDPRINDPSYSLAKDEAYRIDEALPSAGRERPEVFDDFIRQVSVCLARTGEVSR